MMNTEKKIDSFINKDSRIKVYWDDKPENYSKESKNKIRNYFANKYGVNKNNINVIYRPVKFTDKGELIEISGAGIDNIMDINYQRALMKEIIARENKNVDFDRILALDDKVNGELNVDLTQSQHKSWSIKWMMIDNFLSFGSENFVPYSNLKGLTIVNSTPSNQGGKSTLTIDAIKFLLYGTTTKTDKNEEIFNTFSDKNELVVKGLIEFEGDEFVIERKMRRTPKKSGGWTVVNKVNYYKILPDSEEEEMNEEDAKRTTIKIRETIGSEKDFEMLVLANEKNLDDLIGLTTTESGKLLTRLIGLEILELKEGVARTMYNEFSRKKKSNDYDIITLGVEIEDHEQKIVLSEELYKDLNKNLEETKNQIIVLNNEKESLLNNKEKVDVEISSLNPSSLENEIETLTDKGKSVKSKMVAIDEQIKGMGDIFFDEDKHYAISKKLSGLTSDKAVRESDVKRLKRVVSDLIAGGICQSCNRKLDDVDNTDHINKHNGEIDNLVLEIEQLNKDIDSLNIELSELNTKKVLIDTKNKLELDRDRLDVEIGSLRNKVVSKMNDLKKYKLNLESIEHNKKIDISVLKVKTDLNVLEHKKDDLIGKIQRVNSDIEQNKLNIVNKNKLIEIIKKEEEVEKVFKVYIDLVGKKGISKLVLRSVLPIINSELQRMLEDVCDFDVEIFIDDKNDVQFLLNKDNTSKHLKSGSGFEKTASSLALRSILGKMSTLPMPNFITFDEVFGKVASDNLDNLRGLFEKIKDMYETVFLITHNDIVKDWADNVVTVVKTNNISKISIK